MKSRLALVAALAVALAAPLARGEADADRVARAREHFHKGTMLYDLRRYAEAAREYELAFELKDDPALLFNIAQAYRNANMYAESIASYRAYLRREGARSKHRAEVEARIHEMTALLEESRKLQEQPPHGPAETSAVAASPTTTTTAAPATATAATEPPAPATLAATPAGPPPAPSGVQRHARALRIAGLAGAAVGIAAIGVGAGFAVLAKRTSDQISNAPQDQPFDPGLYRRGRADQSAAIGLFAGGAALTVAGAAVALVGWRATPTRRFAIAPVITASQVGASAAVGF